MGGFGWIAVIGALVQYGFAIALSEAPAANALERPIIDEIKNHVVDEIKNHVVDENKHPIIDEIDNQVDEINNQVVDDNNNSINDDDKSDSIADVINKVVDDRVERPSPNVRNPRALLAFRKNEPTELCHAVFEEMAAHPSAEAQQTLRILLNNLFDPAKEPQDSPDRRIAAAFDRMDQLIFVSDGGDGSAGDLVNYMDRIIKCQVEPMSEMKTIVSKLLSIGFQKSLRSAFVERLLRGNENYNPSLMLDYEGHNLMHSAVLSGVWQVPTTLYILEDNKNHYGDGFRKSGGPWWLVSALLHKNDAGQQPLQLAKTVEMANRLKRVFRIFIFYYEIRAKQFGIEDLMDEVDEVLRRSSN